MWELELERVGTGRGIMGKFLRDMKELGKVEQANVGVGVGVWTLVSWKGLHTSLRAFEKAGRAVIRGVGPGQKLLPCPVTPTYHEVESYTGSALMIGILLEN